MLSLWSYSVVRFRVGDVISGSPNKFPKQSLKSSLLQFQGICACMQPPANGANTKVHSNVYRCKDIAHELASGEPRPSSGECDPVESNSMREGAVVNENHSYIIHLIARL